ncbi:MAG: hypothetical protein BWY04_01452 [candidate division CPR1 bacterium ADurb.Bin160]|uniref:Spore protein YkvP/CgeB glycosyl transferase-like domain-containing protein n=1 Tax=candidate division CPR1 bacterium ADurb.Bin160 TaxID=1852826 RepID=A0A1V5ZIZ6_9BACT|nr:MAG: hypothetical protein BWY04_01452 [candidate division CPR1 bacterium ADurb.Bin160]
MSRILISYFSDYGEAMYDAICKELLNNGNDVLRINTEGVILYQKWGEECKLKNKEIIKKVLKFKPNLVMNFNNSLPIEITQMLNCPNCIIDADNPETFWNKKYIKNNHKKFKFLGLQKYSKTMYRKLLSHKINNKNYLFFPPATSVKAQKLQKKFNISFIGSNFFPLRIPDEDFFYSKNAINIYKKYKKNYFYDCDKEYGGNIKKRNEHKTICETIRAFYVGQDRLKHMSVLTDLGFTFFGVRWWNKIAYYDFDIASCFNPKKITTNIENQWVYNSSKISINISHPQAKSSFSWRVMDIMASDSCLLTEYKEDWNELFGKYISKEVKEAIIYNNRYELRQKCITLLDNEKLRNKCIEELQNAIEKNGRWHKRLLKLQQFTKVPIIDIENNHPFYEKVNFKRSKPESPQSKKNKTKLRIRTRVRLILCSVLLIINQIPFVNKLLIDRDTLFDKIKKTIEDDRYNKN